MTYHTSLAQEPLGLNEQGNTEEWRMKYTPELKLDKMLTERDIVWVDDGGTLEGYVSNTGSKPTIGFYCSISVTSSPT